MVGQISTCTGGGGHAYRLPLFGTLVVTLDALCGLQDACPDPLCICVRQRDEDAHARALYRELGLCLQQLDTFRDLLSALALLYAYDFGCVGATDLTFGVLPWPHAEARVDEGLLDDTDGVPPLCRGIDAFLGDEGGYLAADGREIVLALLLADLELALLEDLRASKKGSAVSSARAHAGMRTHLGDDGVLVGGAEGLLQVLALRELALGDVDVDVGDLEHVVEVCLYSAAPLLDLVLVAGDLCACGLSRAIAEALGDGPQIAFRSF